MIIALDLDGTLLNQERKVPQSTKEYLHYLKKQGEIVVINSGRTVQSAMRKTDSADFANYVIGDSGSTIYDLEKKELVKMHQISLETGEKIFEKVKERCREVSIFSIFTDFYRYCNHWENPDDDCVLFEDYNELKQKSFRISHMSFAPLNKAEVSKIAKEIEEEVPEVNVFVMPDSEGKDSWIEVIHKEAGKFHAVLELADLLGMEKEEIISFGNAMNDWEVIRESGIGVAMKNAVLPIKDIADEITEFDNNMLGVEMWLRNYYEMRVSNPKK